jgi:hypothetical protein
MRTNSLSHSLSSNYHLTAHAELRMQQRGIAPRLIELVLRYGRMIYSRGLAFRVIGHKEVDRYARDGIDLSRAEGIHVLVETDGSVITAYRNHDLRKIRPGKRRHAVYH